MSLFSQLGEISVRNIERNQGPSTIAERHTRKVASDIKKESRYGLQRVRIVGPTLPVELRVPRMDASKRSPFRRFCCTYLILMQVQKRREHYACLLHVFLVEPALALEPRHPRHAGDGAGARDARQKKNEKG